MATDTNERLSDLINDFSTAMLVTDSGNGVMRGRPMRMANIEMDGDLWFVTDGDSAKIEEIEKHPQVAVIFQGGSKFVSLSGKATVTREQSKINELWSEAWKVWFPEGKEDPNLMLLHVEAEQGEYWDNSGLRGLTYAFKAGQAYLQGERPEVGADINAKVDL